MKKILSILLTTLLLTGMLSLGFSAFAGESLTDCRAKFKYGESVLDYMYYSPKKSTDDSTKYPLVIMLHGNESGSKIGQQIERYELALWASKESQAKFKNAGGAYIVFPRDPSALSWSDIVMNKLKATVDDFIARNKENIDTSRIYIMGYSIGGKGVLYAISEFKGFFAAAIAMSPVCGSSAVQYTHIKNLPFWLFTCDQETYPNLILSTVKNEWKTIAGGASKKENVRWTRFSSVANFDGTPISGSNKTHDTWDAVARDMHKADGTPFYNSTTIDGNGAYIDLTAPNGVIEWLSSFTLDDQREPVNPPKDEGDSSSSSGESFFARLLRAIREFFKKLFG